MKSIHSAQILNLPAPKGSLLLLQITEERTVWCVRCFTFMFSSDFISVTTECLVIRFSALCILHTWIGETYEWVCQTGIDSCNLLIRPIWLGSTAISRSSWRLTKPGEIWFSSINPSNLGLSQKSTRVAVSELRQLCVNNVSIVHYGRWRNSTCSLFVCCLFLSIFIGSHFSIVLLKNNSGRSIRRPKSQQHHGSIFPLGWCSLAAQVCCCCCSAISVALTSDGMSETYSTELWLRNSHRVDRPCVQHMAAVLDVPHPCQTRPDFPLFMFHMLGGSFLCTWRDAAGCVGGFIWVLGHQNHFRIIR